MNFTIMDCYDLIYLYEMADEVQVEFHYCGDKVLKHTFKVKDYLEYLTNFGDTDVQALSYAARNLGHYLQPYLSRLNGWVVGTDHTEMPKYSEVDVSAAKQGAAGYRYTLDTMDTNVVYSARYKLDLCAGTTLRFEVMLRETQQEAVTMTVDGKSATPTVTDNTYRLDITNIAANHLGTAHTVEMKAGNTTVFKITASVMSYVKTVLDTSEAEDERKAMAALYDYYDKAKEGYQK